MHQCFIKLENFIKSYQTVVISTQQAIAVYSSFSILFIIVFYFFVSLIKVLHYLRFKLFMLHTCR